MKIQLLAYLLLGAVISHSAYAEWHFQGKGRLLDEHQTVSGGAIKGGLINKPIALAAPSLAMGSSSAFAMAVSTTNYINSTFNIFGQHSIYIKNTTLSTQRYKYYYKLCADSSRCFSYTGNIELDPDSVAQNQTMSYLTVQYTSPGTYYSEASTQIVGEQTAYQSDKGYISIMRG